MPLHRYQLGANSRLKREQHIQTLFRSGKAFSVFPIRIVWLLAERGGEASAIRAGFSAPKKKFKQAVHRNRVKRLLREAWRLQQPELLPAIPEGKSLQLFLLFTDAALPEYVVVHAAVGKAISRLKDAISHA